MRPRIQAMRDRLAATGSEGRRQVPGWRHIWTGVAADVLLMVGLFTIAAVLGWAVVVQMRFKPRLESMAQAMSAQARGIHAAYAALPPAERAAFVDALNRYGGGLVRTQGSDNARFGEPVLGIGRDVVAHVRAQLPELVVRATPWPDSELLVRVSAPDGQSEWLVFDGAAITQGLLPMLFGFLLVVLASAGFLVHRTRQRLAWLAQALDEVDPDVSVLPRPPGEDADADAGQEHAHLQQHFHRMAERLAHARDEQEILLARLADELRAALVRLGQAQPHSPCAVEAARCIDAIVMAAGQLDQFARRRAQAAVLATHLNEVLMGLAADAQAQGLHGIHWALGGLPYAGIPEADARRLFGHLLDNALRHGGGEVEVTSALEHSWIVVRVMDRGPGLPADVLARLARVRQADDGDLPTQPAGPGIGLAVARQVTEVNGGILQLRPREGGGLQAEAWLPPARLD